MSAAEFRAALRDEACGPASFVTESAAKPAPDNAADESAQAYIMPNAGPLAVAQSGTTGTQLGAKQQLLAACQAAEHWLQAELDRTGETRPDDILRVLRAAIERAEGQRKPRETRQPGQSRHSSRRPRGSSKEAMLIEMLRRPEGATIAQIESQYVTLERRTGRSTSCPAEALCYGETVSKSLAAPEDFKRRLLKETEHVEC